MYIVWYKTYDLIYDVNEVGLLLEEIYIFPVVPAPALLENCQNLKNWTKLHYSSLSLLCGRRRGGGVYGVCWLHHCSEGRESWASSEPALPAANQWDQCEPETNTSLQLLWSRDKHPVAAVSLLEPGGAQCSRHRHHHPWTESLTPPATGHDRSHGHLPPSPGAGNHQLRWDQHCPHHNMGGERGRRSLIFHFNIQIKIF